MPNSVIAFTAFKSVRVRLIMIKVQHYALLNYDVIQKLIFRNKFSIFHPVTKIHEKTPKKTKETFFIFHVMERQTFLI